MFLIKCNLGWFNGFDATGVHFTDRPSIAWAFTGKESASGVAVILAGMASDVEVLPY